MYNQNKKKGDTRTFRIRKERLTFWKELIEFYGAKIKAYHTEEIVNKEGKEIISHMILHFYVGESLCKFSFRNGEMITMNEIYHHPVYKHVTTTNVNRLPDEEKKLIENLKERIYFEVATEPVFKNLRLRHITGALKNKKVRLIVLKTTETL